MLCHKQQHRVLSSEQAVDYEDALHWLALSLVLQCWVLAECACCIATKLSSSQSSGKALNIAIVSASVSGRVSCCKAVGVTAGSMENSLMQCRCTDSSTPCEPAGLGPSGI